MKSFYLLQDANDKEIYIMDSEAFQKWTQKLFKNGLRSFPKDADWKINPITGLILKIRSETKTKSL